MQSVRRSGPVIGTVVALVVAGGCSADRSVDDGPRSSTKAAATATKKARPTSTGKAKPRVPEPDPAAYAPDDPASWSNRQLAAQLVFAAVGADAVPSAEPWAKAGVGGIFIVGKGATAGIGKQFARVRAAGGDVPPFIGSDEEGGAVQRLREVIDPIPSAETMARTMTPAQVEKRAYDYGRRMRALNVDVGFAPVADLAIPGQYIEQSDRAFSADPAKTSAYARAWARGLARAKVVPVVKHWPGHGEVSDTHEGKATTPKLAALEKRDLIPFDDSFEAGVPAVMVGHLTVPGLTEKGVPATLSPKAMRYLRKQAGDDVLIVTDSLSMGAVTDLKLTVPQAAVRSLVAGADIALFADGSPEPAIKQIAAAIDAGRLPRARAIKSVQRVLRLKATVKR